MSNRNRNNSNRKKKDSWDSGNNFPPLGSPRSPSSLQKQGFPGDKVEDNKKSKEGMSSSDPNQRNEDGSKPEDEHERRIEPELSLSEDEEEGEEGEEVRKLSPKMKKANDEREELERKRLSIEVTSRMNDENKFSQRANRILVDNVASRRNLEFKSRLTKETEKRETEASQLDSTFDMYDQQEQPGEEYDEQFPLVPHEEEEQKISLTLAKNNEEDGKAIKVTLHQQQEEDHEEDVMLGGDDEEEDEGEELGEDEIQFYGKLREQVEKVDEKYQVEIDEHYATHMELEDYLLRISECLGDLDTEKPRLLYRDHPTFERVYRTIKRLKHQRSELGHQLQIDKHILEERLHTVSKKLHEYRMKSKKKEKLDFMRLNHTKRKLGEKLVKIERMKCEKEELQYLLEEERTRVRNLEKKGEENEMIIELLKDQKWKFEVERSTMKGKLWVRKLTIVLLIFLMFLMIGIVTFLK